ncbi:hypothetical protein PENSPDRAFT_754143 [Peniophora sp. CONT]|nr:hypothetical protein PENSPDRAFT_754143 [Peniophora sp. CONT]
MPSKLTTAGHVSDSQITDAVVAYPLGRAIRLRIDLEGCYRGLPEFGRYSERSTPRELYYVHFEASPYENLRSEVYSSQVWQDRASPRGTVQWDEILYLECYERTVLKIELYSDHRYHGVAFRPVAELLTRSELKLCNRRASPGKPSYFLRLSASKIHTSDDNANKWRYDSQIGYKTENRHDEEHLNLRVPMNISTTCVSDSLHDLIRQLSSFMDAIHQLNVPFDTISISACAYWTQRWACTAYRGSLSQRAHHPRVNTLMASVVSITSAVLPVASTYLQRRAEYAAEIMTQLYWTTSIMDDFVYDGMSQDGCRNPEMELARLAWIIVTPDPTIGCSNTSASSNRHTISGTIVKDALLFALEAVVQSSDAFPPLKSAASGLLFFATSAEMASSNKKQVRDIYKRIDGLAASLQHGTVKGSPITPGHQEAIKALAEDIAYLNEELNEIVEERKSRFRRFFAAKRHRNALQDVVTQLDTARMDYIMAMATLDATTMADVHGHVKAITLVLNAQPVLAPGTRRADAVS